MPDFSLAGGGFGVFEIVISFGDDHIVTGFAHSSDQPIPVSGAGDIGNRGAFIREVNDCG